MTEVEEQPPPVMTALRRVVEELCAGRGDVVVEHDFVNEPGSYGWNTTLSPVGRGLGVWFWFDGFDDDLMLMVDDEYYFEWLDLTDEAAVVADVLGMCSAVLAGHLHVRREGRWRHLDLWTTDGRRWTGRGGRDSHLPWKRSVLDGRLPGYGQVSEAMKSVCRVCGYDEGEDRWTGSDGAQYIICSCCGAESGVDDRDLRWVREYRAKWHADGCGWFSADERPEGWRPEWQAANIPPEWR